MFCSVDSEQSLPRTAPLATPEQDMSLLDSLPVDRNLIRESLDDVNIDVLDEEEVVMRVSLYETLPPGMSQVGSNRL